MRFAFFGAEENGLNGSKAYAASLDTDAVAKLLAMVNYDTIAGVTSSMSTRPTPTWPSTTAPTRATTASIPRCAIACWPSPSRPPPRSPSTPATAATRKGRPAAGPIMPLCLPGVPIAYVEATNFTINGEDGYDGYSQSTNPALWDCYDDATKSACDRDSETQWGKIWHTEHDRLDKMAELFPGRIEQQLGATPT